MALFVLLVTIPLYTFNRIAHVLTTIGGGCGKRFFFFFVKELATIVAVIRRLSWCIEKASAKSNAAVHRRGSFINVHRRGKHRDPVVFPPLLPAIA
ncbi:hypothetical protein JHK84_047966 [Glycine max]|nr:hypothetical protein JHK86_047938 [Glycine max]KAG4943902.1 hypothetical protein JHK85_048548 [Glycine max]KAG5102997.1 hypothetical protein JHK84_047966 [Glycine max]